MAQLDVSLRIRCSEDDRDKLAYLAKATGDSESAVMRQLIQLGYKRVSETEIANRLEGKGAKRLELALEAGTDNTTEGVRSILLVAEFLRERGRMDLWVEVLDVIFNPLLKAETAARLNGMSHVFAADSQKEITLNGS